MLKKIFNHVFRWWDEDDILPHPLLKVVPPFLLEVLALLFVGAILYGIGRAVFEALLG